MQKNLDIDFENFHLSDERAFTIRNNVEKIKHTGWVEDLRTLILERGAEERLEDGSDDFLPGIVSDAKPRVFRSTKIHDLSASLLGADMRVKLGPHILLDVSFLPKDKDFVIFFVNDQKWAEISEVFEILQEEMKTAKKQKSERAAAFKAKFQ
jgi:hypothetical protein